MLRRTAPSFLAVILAVGIFAVPAGAEKTPLDAESAFEHLVALAGEWKGIPDASGLSEEEAKAKEESPMPEVIHQIQVSANGSVVMETMNPGTDHEMINMYHLDGEELVMTHYCAGANQPTMKLDRQKSSAERLVFDFTGGTNLDPEVDGHIHNAELLLKGANQMESRWTSYNGGAPAGEMIFHLERSE